MLTLLLFSIVFLRPIFPFGDTQTVAAQLTIPQGNSAPLTVTYSPTYPQAHKEVTAHVQSSRADLTQAVISWFLNGELLDTGTGLTSVRFSSGDLGKQQILQVNAETGQGTLRATVSIVPASVDLIWESDSYTPPFYRGKALNTRDTPVRIVAMPTFVTPAGTILTPGSLTYRWLKDGVVQGYASGRGKNVFMLDTISIVHGKSTISLEVISPDGAIKAGKQIAVKTHEPMVVLYENDPLLGLQFERAVGDRFNMARQETTITAIPYFFSIKDIGDPNIDYRWNVNNQPIPDDTAGNNSITLRQEGQGGQGIVGVGVRHLTNTFEVFQKQVRVFFESTAN